MKKQLIIAIAFCLTLSSTVAFARGGMSGMGMSHMMGPTQIGAGGSFGVESVPGKGTTIHAETPFHNGEEA